MDLSAYRIMQEAVTNVLKHARASRVVCTIRYGEDAVRLDAWPHSAQRVVVRDYLD